MPDHASVVLAIATLASREMQVRYVAEGDASEYLLANEILQDAVSSKYWIDDPRHAGFLTENERAALDDVLTAIDRNIDAALAPETFEAMGEAIRNGAAWKALRAEASRACIVYGLPAHPSIADCEALEEAALKDP